MARPRKTWHILTSARWVLAALLLGGLCVFARAGAAEDPATAPTASAPTEGEGEGFAETPDPVISKVQSLYEQPAERPTPPPPRTQETSFGSQILRVFGVLAALCGVIVLLGYVSKKYLPNTPALAGLKLGTVLGRVYLSPKASLHYVKTGGRVLVVGVTPAGIHLLTEFEAESFEASLLNPETAEEPTKDVLSPNFLEYLNASQRPARAAADDDIANLRGEIQRLSEFLRDVGREPHA